MAAMKNACMKCGSSLRASMRSMSSRMALTLLASITSEVSAYSLSRPFIAAVSSDASTTWFRRARTSGSSP